MAVQELICVICPLGCHLKVDVEQDFAVEGNKCSRGEAYAREELIAPKRVVTSTVKIRDAVHSRLPVRTSVAIPKERVFDCMALINGIETQSPVRMGDVMAADILGLDGVDLIASRDM